MEHTVLSVDIAKKVFQLQWVAMDTGCIERMQLKRAKLLEWFANRAAALVVMRGDVRGIAKAVQLETGQGYWVDAHGLWLTNGEVEAMTEEREVQRVNGLAAHFAPT